MRARIVVALAGLVTVGAPAALAQPERPRELPRYMGHWTAEGGGWRVAIDITGSAITPSRSVIRIAIACGDEPTLHTYGHIVEAKELDVLVRYRERGPLLRLYGTVPQIAIATVSGRHACERRAALPLARGQDGGT